MRKLSKLISVFLCLAILCSLAPAVSAAAPRILTIKTAEDLVKFAENCRLDDYSKGLHVILSEDIDLTGISFSPIPVFNGIFNGNGHRITGILIESAGSSQGFFRTLSATATVSDLHLEGSVSPNGSAGDVGGIAGINGGSIKGCSFTGTVSGVNRVGGIAGTNALTGVIDGCSSAGSVHGNHFVGGIAGDSTGVIRSSENSAKVNTTVEQNDVALEDITLESITGSEYAATITDIGGICGTGSGIIKDCKNNGDVGYPLIGYNIGGIAGSHTGYIAECANHGVINGRKEVGGIVGQLEPAVSILYAEDTMQTLQAQLNDMTASAGSAGSHIQDGANALGVFSNQLEAQIANAQNALALLIPDPNNPELPDPDTLEAARIALSSSLSGISSALSTMLASGMNAFGGLTQDIQTLTGQMNQIGNTIGAAADNLGMGMSDISDLDTESDFTSKLDSCRNYGSISGDWNVGGIVGAMSVENDLDPESDLQLIGSSSLNFDVEVRSVVLDCENSGSVSGNKQNIGGIVGWSSMGLVRSCINTATVAAPGADYVGGVAGLSQGYLRSCGAKCAISGETYVGGISGLGAIVTDCRAIVTLDGQQEKFGAILGDMRDAAPEGNYYLPVDTDYGAIDGVSYGAKAEALAADKFFELEDIPGAFRLVNVTFIFEDGSTRHSTVPYGSSLGIVDFPSIPEKAGFDARWEGPIGPTDAATLDVTFKIVFTEHIRTLESALKDSDGRPVLLLQGEFSQDAVLEAEAMNADGYTSAWSFTLPQSVSSMKLRCLLPKDLTDGTFTAQLRQSDGTWTDAPATVDGSYLVLSVTDGCTAVRLTHVPNNYTLYIILGAAVLLILLIVIIVTAILRKKRK